MQRHVFGSDQDTALLLRGAHRYYKGTFGNALPPEAAPHALVTELGKLRLPEVFGGSNCAGTLAVDA